MRRLVYAPKAYVYVKNAQNQIMDLSAFVTAGTVSRKVNQVSAAGITLRNPDMLFTSPVPTFAPMDPIVIYLQRIRSRPVRVFTGFLDKTPWMTLYPGTITLSASCTLKKLLYTFFDPALPYTRSFMEEYGWMVDGQGQVLNPDAFKPMDVKDLKDPRESSVVTDGSIGNLLFATMKHIGGWHPDTIHIQKLPPDLPKRMAQLAISFEEDNKALKEEFEALMSKIIGEGGYGGDQAGYEEGNYDGPLNKLFPAHYLDQAKGKARLSHAQVKELAAAAGLPPEMFALISKGESQYYPGVVQRDPGDGHVGHGLWQITPTACCVAGSAAGKYLESLGGIDQMRNPWKCAKMAKFLYEHAGSKIPNTDGFPWFGTHYLQGAPASVINEKPPKKRPKTPTADSSTTEQRAEVRSSKAASKKSTAKGDKLYSPVKGMAVSGIGQGGGAYGAPRDYGKHAGIDAPSAMGQTWFAIADGEVVAATNDWTQGSGCVVIKVTQKIDNYPTPLYLGYGGTQSISVEKGDPVDAGQPIAKGGTHGSGPHLHFFVRTSDGSPTNGEIDPTALIKAAANGEQPKGGPGSDAGSDVDSGGSGTDEMHGVAQASAFAAQFEWPTIQETMLATALQGHKSLMNDRPLMPFIEQLAGGALRQFQSLPNGHFYAFYPDYFGEFGRKPYWEIDDIEILDGNVELSDEALATHVYVVGDTFPGGGIDMNDKLFAGGVVTIFNAFMNEKFLNRPDATPETNHPQGDVEAYENLIGKDDAVAFLKRYGARPFLKEDPLIRNPYFEAFQAYQQFMLMWSRQFLTPFTFTFMPELYPGGQVAFPDHGLQMYIDEVEHSWDYESGFVTQANLSAPSAIEGNENASKLPPSMIRSQQALYEPVRTALPGTTGVQPGPPGQGPRPG